MTVAASAAGGMLSFPGEVEATHSEAKLKVLMLGGTYFVGPHLVNQCLRRGHQVTLFNRGKTNPGLFPALEWVEGNRYSEKGKGLQGLRGSRTWDIVIDTWQGPPGCVAKTSELLKDRARQYIFISSIAAFKDYRIHGITEEYPLLEVADLIDSKDPELDYSSRKRAGELAVKRYFQERSTILRCGSIRGESYTSNPRDLMNYYEYHLMLGNTLILPDDLTAKLQLIDVKDLAQFATKVINNQLHGDYNMVGPEEPLPFKDFLKISHKATGGLSELVWVDPDWLVKKGVRPWVDIPNWVRMNEADPGFYTISNQKAINAGLTFRPTFTTIVDGLPNLSVNQLQELDVSGLKDESRIALIEAWKEGNESTKK